MLLMFWKILSKERICGLLGGCVKDVTFTFNLQVRVVNGVPPTGDYSFAKYNRVSNTVFYLSYESNVLLSYSCHNMSAIFLYCSQWML